MAGMMARAAMRAAKTAMRERSVAIEVRAASLRRGAELCTGSDIGVYSFGYGFGGSARERAREGKFVVCRCVAWNALLNMNIERCSICIVHPSPQK